MSVFMQRTMDIKQRTATCRAWNRSLRAFRPDPKTDIVLALYGQYIADRFAFPIVLSTSRTFGSDYGIALHAVHILPNAVLRTGFLGSRGAMDRRGHINKDGLDAYMFNKDRLDALNTVLYAAYEHQLNGRLRLIGNVQWAANRRDSRDVFPQPELRPWYSRSSHKYRYFHSANISMDRHYTAFNPRMGFIYNAGKHQDVQFFGNVSGSYEPPTFDDLVGTKVADNINTSPKAIFAIRLDRQSARTVELGTPAIASAGTYRCTGPG